MPRKNVTSSTSTAASGRRRSTRLSRESANDEAEKAKEQHNDHPPPSESESEEEEEEEEEDERRFEFEGTVYSTYQEMVNAKRKRNEEYLKQNGLWNPMQKIREANKEASQNRNGIKRRKVSADTSTKKNPISRRKSNRLAGTPSDGKFIEDERGGSFVIAGESTNAADGGVQMTRTTRNSKTQQTTTTTVVGGVKHNGRINDGGPLSLEDAIQNCDPKWIQETSVESAKQFTKDILAPSIITSSDTNKTESRKSSKSPTSVVDKHTTSSPMNTDDIDMDTIHSKIQQLSVDDDNMVAKVTPDRIYSVAAHPSKTHLVVGAGDKNGYCGIWNVDNKSAGGTDGVHLFRPHTRPVNSLEWTSQGQGLLSSSYDGTVRYFDVASESFEEIFATSGDDDDHFYTQYLALDPRASREDQSFFLSTSIGTVMHIDRRVGGSSSSRSSAAKGNVTFNAALSEKKINSVSLHRDGYCLATAGLDRTVKFWDLRKFGGSKSTSKASEPYEPKGAYLGEHFNKLSVNSAFFSPSGDYLMSTNMANTINVYHQAHLQLASAGNTKKKGGAAVNIVEPMHVIRHDNHTGRWLTTFMAQWHPTLDIFCVGSMSKPRAIDVFDGASGDLVRAIRGDVLSAVASRCCFHSSTDQLVLIGGNSSGRVTIIR